MVQARVTELVRQEKLGVIVDQCSVVSIPPRQCKEAFDAVLTAVSTRDTVHNDALKYENEVVTKAEAESVNRTNVAETERVRLVSSVQAEAERFSAWLAKSSPDQPVNAVRKRAVEQRRLAMFSPTLRTRFTCLSGRKVIAKTRELRLQLSREPQAPTPANP